MIPSPLLLLCMKNIQLVSIFCFHDSSFTSTPLHLRHQWLHYLFVLNVMPNLYVRRTSLYLNNLYYLQHSGFLKDHHVCNKFHIIGSLPWYLVIVTTFLIVSVVGIKGYLVPFASYRIITWCTLLRRNFRCFWLATATNWNICLFCVLTSGRGLLWI